MKLSIANVINAAAESMGINCSVQENYSGRGMFGKSTAALVINQNDWIVVVAQVSRLMSKSEGQKVDGFFTLLEKK